MTRVGQPGFPPAEELVMEAVERYPSAFAPRNVATMTT